MLLAISPLFLKNERKPQWRMNARAALTTTQPLSLKGPVMARCHPTVSGSERSRILKAHRELEQILRRALETQDAFDVCYITSEVVNTVVFFVSEYCGAGGGDEIQRRARFPADMTSERNALRTVSLGGSRCLREPLCPDGSA